jgi:hypothetical protein
LSDLPEATPLVELAADLSGLDLVAVMVDGIRVAEHCCVVALCTPSAAPKFRCAWGARSKPSRCRLILMDQPTEEVAPAQPIKNRPLVGSPGTDGTGAM